ncbi:MAG: hypothetical protein GF398_05885 [Chitinivibrionales bacterium]|nr:hypothetical protein [Chitinivibrionales bacterium]
MLVAMPSPAVFTKRPLDTILDDHHNTGRTSEMRKARGNLTMQALTPNPLGAFDKLYALSGTLHPTRLELCIPEDGSYPPTNTITIPRLLTLLHVNDLHNTITDHHIKGDVHVLGQIAAKVNNARRNRSPHESVLFLSAGDDHIGTIYDELLGANAAEFKMSAPWTAYSALGMDAAVIGNHELDKGAVVLREAIRRNAAFPVLSANVVHSALDMGTHPAVIGLSDGLRIGIIGLTTIVDAYLETEKDPALQGLDPLHTVAKLAQAISPHVDALVILNHLGYNGELPPDQPQRYRIEQGDVQVARTIASLTDKPCVLLSGHTHYALNRTGLDADKHLIEGIPIAQAGHFGEFVGKVTLHIHPRPHRATAAPRAELLSTMSRRIIHPGHADHNLPLEQPDDYDQDFQRSVLDPLHRELDHVMHQTIGIIVSSPDLSDAATVTDRYCGESAIANFMNDAIVARSTNFPGGAVDFAAFNASGLRGIDIDGPFCFHDWYAVMPWADEIVIVNLTGADLRHIISRNAAHITRKSELAAHTVPPVTNGFHVSGFLHFSAGIRYAIRMRGAAKQNISVHDITLGKVPIDRLLDNTYRMAFPSYIANGRENRDNDTCYRDADTGVEITFASLLASQKTTGLMYRNEIIAYIRNRAGGVVGASTGAKKDGRLHLACEK